ncbi:DNA-directed RNA polymerase I subunit RPA2 [Echinococcus granulosus]|uniref:DNA-directed RNA polymerase n=1 Tax=Echinococcus granulosus TaxID=6210 RepID=W6UCK2_ECHGR|nr:DNA-directed RNA polymerase I subunit RPA2 [Echinococcus granulosus]EUB58436.1 DNA-directed RNA polymerase I subunit RPA2 [Echinococcus granulosus]
MQPVYITTSQGDEYSMKIECRRTRRTYGGNLSLAVRIRRNDCDMGIVEVGGGEIPIMILSSACNLSGLPRSDFPKHNEGGYFIVNGNERILRLLIMARRNYPLAIARSSFKKRGPSYTEYAILMRCVRDDEHSAPVILHWVMNGEPTLAFTVENEQLFVPISILLRALMDKTELEIYEDIRRGGGDSLSLEEHAMRILMRLQKGDYNCQSRALCYLGKLFRLKMHLPTSYTDYAAGEHLMREYVVIHVDSFADKYHILCYMIRKLHAFISGACCAESNDNLMFQEVLLPGTTYVQILRNRLITYLHTVREHLNLHLRKTSKLLEIANFRQALNRSISEVSSGLNLFISTGNLPGSSRTVLGRLLNGQTSGLSVPIDTVNFLRFAAQFRAVHRGAMFNEMRTTSVRRLLPEAWGFICPVHTPDGAPCGLLNHLAESTEAVCVTPSQALVSKFAAWLLEHNLRPVELSRQMTGVNERRGVFPVLLDGRLVGWSPSSLAAQRLARELRCAKLDPNCPHVPTTLEICLVVPTDTGSQYPGLFLFVGGSRLLRPVKSLVRVGSKNIAEAEIELVGTFEQPYMDIAVTVEELMERPVSERMHFEVSPESIFSFVASLTPYPDFNQSPRNMYQCQMAKQTMGHSSYTWKYRSDPKAYRLLNPQSPLVRTKTYTKYDVDHYPLGFNAIVAVMSYTGYDMEDAMVINKSSYERGFADACIYKSEIIDLVNFSAKGRAKKQADHYFGGLVDLPPNIDIDGFPPIGTRLIPGKSILFVYTHNETMEMTAVRYKDGEQIAYVEAACITLRLPRRPDIGDKYSSRHGQKGINSILLPADDMPWTVESGIVPDLIFNPHGFPTRMTMGMMIEFLAGKSAALSGERVDATPFQWTEENPPFEKYADQLKNAGFNYWGTEAMMSGVTGRLLEAHIFIGVVYYQRLRHMVADKYQVRAEGRFDPVLRQPIKGRKVGGGVRLGEMERDCVLSHGLSFTLQDRLLGSNCDKVKMLICSGCGGLIHEDLITDETLSIQQRGNSLINRLRWRCRLCNQSPPSSAANIFENKMLLVDVPAAFRYLTYELACLNVNTRIEVEQFT